MSKHNFDPVLIDKLIDWENGTLSPDDTVDLFQHLIDTGLCWALQGSYGRNAVVLIEHGLCTASTEGWQAHQDREYDDRQRRALAEDDEQAAYLQHRSGVRR